MRGRYSDAALYMVLCDTAVPFRDPISASQSDVRAESASDIRARVCGWLPVERKDWEKLTVCVPVPISGQGKRCTADASRMAASGWDRSGPIRSSYAASSMAIGAADSLILGWRTWDPGWGFWVKGFRFTSLFRILFDLGCQHLGDQFSCSHKRTN